MTTGADGTALISWLGAKVGTDTLTAFVDRDGNGVWDVNTEPRQIVTVTFAPLPPPVPGKSVERAGRLRPGLHQAPGGPGPRAGGAAARASCRSRARPTCPVGSQLDTEKGRVALTSAADTGGAKTQTSDFYQGIFQVKQSVPKKKPKKPKALITDLVHEGSDRRGRSARRSRARGRPARHKKKGPKSVLGKLWGNGKGKFRTTGKYSSATVRGTIWLVRTLRGHADQGQPRHRPGGGLQAQKTVTVKAGHSYLARAGRAARKSSGKK